MVENQYNVKILVGYHKKATLLKNDIMVPIHLGRAVKNLSDKDGKRSNEELEWLLNNMIGDDTGDNISNLNRNINEMTAIYWAWKNYDKLGDPSYIGLAHYRSVLLVAPCPRYYRQSLLDILGYPYDLYNQLRENIDFIAGEFYSRGHSVYQDWVNMTNCTTDRSLKHLEFLTNYIKENHKNLYHIWDEYLYQNYVGGQKSIFVMKKNLFFEYCSFMFDVLFAMSKFFDDDGVNKGNCRVVGKAAEFLSSFYFYYLMKQGYSYKTFPIVNVPTYENHYEIFSDLIQYDSIKYNYYKSRFLCNFTWGNKKNHYVKKKNLLKNKLDRIEELKISLNS